MCSLKELWPSLLAGQPTMQMLSRIRSKWVCHCCVAPRGPNMKTENRINKHCMIMDIAVLHNKVNTKEIEKLDKYQDLARELKRLWKTKTTVIPTVVGTLDATPKMPPKRLKDFESESHIVNLKKSSILYPARISWNILEIWEELLLPNSK